MGSPSVDRLGEYFEALARGDIEALRDHYSEDVVWHVGGTHPLAGTYRGRDSLLDYFERVRELTGGTLRVTPEEVLSGDRHTVMFTRATAQRDDRRLDVGLAQVLEVGEDGRWSEYWAVADDPAAVDAFWAEA